MKTNFKKVLCAFLVVVMCLTMAPLQGFTELELPDFEIGNLFSTTAKAATQGYYTYTVSDGEATITDVDEAISGVITIPSTLGGFTVTTIGYKAFEYCTRLTGITIPNSVTSIDSYAFRGCESLTSITIGDSVTSIGYSAFYNCESLTSITIGDSVTSIGSSAFADCTGLTSITIPNSVTSIGSYAFRGCESLTSITIGDSVTSIGSSAFEDCTGLTSITIPNSVTSIGSSAFEDCTGLTSITIPNSVTSIGYSAFRGCESLTSITIPNSVTSIGDYAFSYCESLTSVTIPNSVKSIGDSVFEDCTGLTSITIPNSVTSIGSYAFYNCESLTSITILDSVTNIGFNAFSNTAYYNNVENWNNGVLYIDNYLIKANADVLSGAYTVKDGIKLIASEAFYDCAGLTNITLPDSLTTICDMAFDDCDALTSVIIPDSVTTIGPGAFCSCNNLDSISIPDSVKTIDRYAFDYTAYYNNAENWNNGVLYINNHLIKANADEISGSYTVKDGTKVIAGDAFAGCENLESITIPDSVTSICDDAFYKCSILNVHIESLAAWCNIDFDGYYSNPLFYGGTYGGGSLYINGEPITELIIPESAKEIKSCAFIGFATLEKIIIPYTVTNIGASAFFGCSSLETVYLTNNLKTIETEGFFACGKLSDIYFIGTEEQWSNIVIHAENQSLAHTNIHFIDCPHMATKEFPSKEASCTEAGYTAGTQCTICGEILVTQTEIPVKDHSYNTSVTLPTCTATGYTTYTCSVCGDTYKADEVAMLEHTMGEWTVTKSATCEEKGTEERTCIYCDYSETREIAETDHTDNDNDGYCDNCGTDISDTDEPGTGEPGTDEPGTDESEDSASCVNWFLEFLKQIKEFFSKIIEFFRSIGDFT